jgi:hypothetical protein
MTGFGDGELNFFAHKNQIIELLTYQMQAAFRLHKAG